MNINKNLKELRLKRGMSIYQLSKVSDISETYIRTIERGNSQPSIQVLTTLLAELDTNISDFFYDGKTSTDYSPMEKSLIEEFRQLSDDKAEAVFNIVKLFNS